MTAESENQTAEQGSEEPKEPSLGPACLVLTIVGLALSSAFCAFGSYVVFIDQYPMARKSIGNQLIPWVESSNLEEPDRSAIVQQLEDLVLRTVPEQMDREQLMRLRNGLTDNPVLLWGNVQSILKQADALDFTDVERQTLKRLTERLLRMAAERKLSRNDLEYTIQQFSTVRADGLSIEVNDDLTVEQVREFIKRAGGLVEQSDIPNEPYDKTPSQAFAILINDALDLNR